MRTSRMAEVSYARICFLDSRNKFYTKPVKDIKESEYDDNEDHFAPKDLKDFNPKKFTTVNGFASLPVLKNMIILSIINVL